MDEPPSDMRPDPFADDAGGAPAQSEPSTLPSPDPDEAGYCWKCGYDLRGLAAPRCPECGFRFDPEGVVDLNREWCAARLEGFRNANALMGVSCAAAVVSVLTAASPLWLVLVLALIAFVLFWKAVEHALEIRADLAVTRAERAARETVLGFVHGRLPAAVLAILFAWLLATSWLALRFALLAGGVVLAGLELQRYHEGRRRHHLFGVPDDAVRSLTLGAGMTVVLVGVSVLAILMLAAFGR